MLHYINKFQDTALAYASNRKTWPTNQFVSPAPSEIPAWCIVGDVVSLAFLPVGQTHSNQNIIGMH